MAKYVIGVDGGTEGLRAGVFDLSGHPKAFASTPYPTVYPQPSWAEQDPADWWVALGASVKKAVEQAGVGPEEVGAICLDTTCCSVVALDSKGDALRPALLWMDMRSAEQTEQVVATKDEALLVNSQGAGPVSAEWMVPKALWIKQNEPATYHAATYVCEYQDYLNHKLTGRMCASINNATIRWHYSSARAGGWPTTMLEKLGIADLQSKWPQDVLALGARVGGLTKEAAAHLGLPEGLPVAQGGADAFVGMVGLGVLNPGELALLTGSSHLHLGVSPTAFHGPGIWGTYPDCIIPGTHVVEGGQTSTGSIVNWYKRLLGGGDDFYALLNEEAAALPPGCEGLVLLDHFQGNRTPHTDPLSRGAVHGLTLKHTRGHVFRSIIEGICCGTELIFESMRRNGFVPSTVTIAGGATRSELWLQAHADISGIPVRMTKCPDAPALGSAICAAVVAGLYPDIRAAAGAMVHVARTVQPRMEVHAQYQSIYRAYKQLYPALKPLCPGGGGGGGGGRAAAGPITTAPVVAPSMLAADQAALGAEAARMEAAGADWLHIDIVDGHMVPNLTIGPPVVAAMRRHTRCVLDCHCAVTNPEDFVDPLAAAGADQMSFHVEATKDPAALALRIRAAGMRVGAVLRPQIPASEVVPLCEAGLVDYVNCMSVQPGFGGAAFDERALPKLEELRARFPDLPLQVDGGVSVEKGTAQRAAAAGATVIVAGSAVFGADDPAAAIAGLRGVIAG